MDVAPATAHRQLLLFLALLSTGSTPGSFIDVRWRRRGGGMRRRFISASRPADVAELAMRLSTEHDVYVGVTMRDGNTYGGRSAVIGARVAWVESDDRATAELLLSFACPPTLAVASGTPGHLQLYWLLDSRCEPDLLEHTNRRMAAALAGDPASSDAARVLRPPGTLNHKHEPPRPVKLLSYRPAAVYSLRRLADGLPIVDDRPNPLRATTSSRVVRVDVDRRLLAVPAAEYVRKLAGRSANREGKVLCPFHDDTDPSLQIYADGGFYCFGSGCARGGTIFDFASELWGIPPRGAGFLKLRMRLAKEFGFDAGGDRELLGPYARAALPRVAARGAGGC